MTQSTASRNLGRRSRQLRLLLVATTAVGMVVAVGQPGPAGGAASGDEGLRSFCEEVAKRPPTEGIEQTTDPATGAPLQAGQTVKVSLRWDKQEFGPELERVAHCIVTLDGKVRRTTASTGDPSWCPPSWHRVTVSACSASSPARHPTAVLRSASAATRA